MATRAVIFDIGGILERTPPTHWQARWAAELRLQPDDLERRLAPVWKKGEVGAVSEADAIVMVQEELGLTDAQSNRLWIDLWDEYLGTPNEVLIAYFASLAHDYRTAIVSNSFVGAREREQERYGFAEMTELIIYSHEVGVAKPDRAIYALACERLGVAPHEVVFLDDVEENIIAADAFGMRSVLYVDDDQARRQIEDHLAAP